MGVTQVRKAPKASRARTPTLRISFDAEPVPLPWHLRRPANGPPVKYPFGRLAVGESIQVVGDVATRNRAVAAARGWRRNHPGQDITWERQPDSVRFWRLADRPKDADDDV